MMHEDMKEVQNPEEIPQFRSEAEEAEFWAAHSLGDWFFEEAGPVSENILPPARPQTSLLSELLDDVTLLRLKELAYRRGAEPLSLVTDFVVDRLDAEEKGEVALPTASSQVEQSSRQVAQKRSDWLNRVHDYLKEHEELLRDPELTSIATSRMASDSSAMLKQLGQEINAASRKPGYPVSRLNRMEKAFHRLHPFVVRVIETYKEKFGMDEEDPEGEYDVIREAQEILDSP